MSKLVWLFLAGGVGALSRYGLAGLVQRSCGVELPVGTFVVNLVGCGLFGFLWTLADDRLIISGETRFLILTGFVGSFTTFSTFAFETSALMRDAQWWYALGNVAAQNVLGIAGVIVGMSVGRLL